MPNHPNGKAMTSPPRLTHCMMHVADLERAITFYEQALHFVIVDRHRYEGHDLAYLRSAASSVEIELIQPSGKPPEFTGSSAPWHLGFAIENLEAEFARLSRLGVRLDPIEPYVANGVLQTRYFYLYDPDGHQIEFLEAQGRYSMPTIDDGSPDQRGELQR